MRGREDEGGRIALMLPLDPKDCFGVPQSKRRPISTLA